MTDGSFSHLYPPNLKRCLTALGLILLVLTAAYWGSLEGEFVFDDVTSIVENPSLREFDKAFTIKHGNGGWTVDGRPILNFSFFLNYQFSELDIRAYRFLNIVIHGLNTCLLYLLLSYFFNRHRHALNENGQQNQKLNLLEDLPLLTVLLWLCHPIHVNCVTNVVQRAETLAASCILLSLLYGMYVIDVVKADRSQVRLVHGLILAAWMIFASLAKEIVITAPILLLVYHGLFYKKWDWRIQLPLVSAIVLTALMHLVIGGRGDTGGFDGINDSWQYLLTQMRALRIYIIDLLYPLHIALDYGERIAYSGFDILFGSVLIVLCLLSAVVTAMRKPAIAFSMLASMILLLPTTSIIPVATQTIAIHRVYLSSIFLLFALLVAMNSYAQKINKQQKLFSKVAAGVGLLLMLFLIVLTRQRNEVFAKEETIWQENIKASPDNYRGYNNLASYYINRAKNLDQAESLIEKAIQLAPLEEDLVYSMALLKNKQSAFQVSLDIIEKRLETPVKEWIKFQNLKSVNLWRLQSYQASLATSNEILEKAPENVDAYVNRANVWIDIGEFDKAIEDTERAINHAGPLNPRSVTAWSAMGIAYSRLNQMDKAISSYTSGLSLKPNDLNCLKNRANAYISIKALKKAYQDLNRIIKLEPGNQDAIRTLQLVRPHI